MTQPASPDETRHLMKILREAMRDPALSGGCFLLGELFAAIAEEPEARPPMGENFRGSVRATLCEERPELSALLARHTYQCNPPRRLAVSLITAATVAKDWAPAGGIKSSRRLLAGMAARFGRLS